jgi:26S proteasome regulatory subunit N9
MSRLWHQLSIALEKFLQDCRYATTASASGSAATSNGSPIDALQFYDSFIAGIETKLSPVRFAIIISLIGRTLADAGQAADFYEKILFQSRARLGEEAAMCITMDVCVARLKVGGQGQLDEVKKMLDDAKEKLLPMSPSESIVFSKYYAANTEYRKVAGPPQEFYKSALMYLAYTSMEELDPQHKYELATDIALAAATGEGIYNFGEIITNPILLSLKDTPNNWLYDLIVVLNAGDIDNFNTLIDKQRFAYFGQPALVAMHEDVKKKIVFMCLLNIVFERHSHDRTISFQTIADRTRLPYREV